MKFNLTFLGPDDIFQVRRDLFLFVKNALEKCGHDVLITQNRVESKAFNILVGCYFLSPENMKQIVSHNISYAVLNTEIIANDLLNFKVDKVNFVDDYLPFIKAGAFTWDIILENMKEHDRYSNNAHYLRFGYDDELDEIKHTRKKEYDCYFYGIMTPRRIQVVDEIKKRGVSLAVDSLCPYFVRNNRIEKSKVQLAIKQSNIYSHANALRIAYLANNGCAILTEKEIDPGGYLAFTKTTDEHDFIDNALALVENDSYKQLQQETREKYMQNKMSDYMAQLLDESFGK